MSMDPAKRTLLRVVLLTEDRAGTADSVERPMGTTAAARFAFISDKAEIRQRGFAGRVGGDGNSAAAAVDFAAESVFWTVASPFFGLFPPERFPAGVFPG
jgi:hypothetical protein